MSFFHCPIKATFQDQNSRRHARAFPSSRMRLMVIAIVGAFSTTAQAADGLFELGSMPCYEYLAAYGVSGNGKVAVGVAVSETRGTNYSEQAALWTANGGMVSLGALNNGKQSSALAVNATGDVVVGSAQDGNANNYYRAYRWTQATGMVSLGVLSEGENSYASGVNAKGDVVVGGSGFRAFRWTQVTGMVNLGTLNNGFSAEANGVNAAGDVVVGSAEDGSVTNTWTTRAFRWTEATGMVSLGTLNNGKISEAKAVNAAGDVVVGYSWDGNASNHGRAFRWTEATGMVSLGTLAGGEFSSALAVNAKGNVVVGWSASPSYDMSGFRWTAATGMQTIENWLAASGVAVNASGERVTHAMGVDESGNIIVGSLINGHAFIARAQVGLIDTAEYHRSLAGSAAMSSRAIQEAGQVMHGAHGSPMRGLLTGGKQSFWAGGDWGHRDGQGMDGNAGSGEIGYARGITNDVMVKLALGRTDSKSDTVFGGNTKMDGTYLMPEVIAKVSGTPLYASISGYYNWGDADVKRGYDNAGYREYSSGSTDVRTAAIRARLDWLDAAKLGSTALTPYTSLTYTRTKIDGYTETGGGFPVRWDSHKEHSSEMRLGLDAVHPVNDKLNLLGRLEGVHNFNAKGSKVSGNVSDLLAFDLPGQSSKHNWLRVGVGVEGKLGAGTGSLMLNASNQNDSSTYWMAASYRVDF